MKKLFTFLAVLTACLVVLGCASNPDSYVPELSTHAALLGEWTQVNGSSVITIEEKELTFKDMEIGLSGYGTYTFRSESQINLTHRTVDLHGTTDFNSLDETRPFQKEDYEEYHRRFPERMQNLREELKARGIGESGYGFRGKNLFFDFIICNNVLTLTIVNRDQDVINGPSRPVFVALSGEFTKTRESTNYHEGNRER